MSLTPGTRLGPYEVAAQIGVGGMGEVYRAIDTKLKREVAVKVLPAALATDADRLARFQREARGPRVPQPPEHSRDLRPRRRSGFRLRRFGYGGQGSRTLRTRAFDLHPDGERLALAPVAETQTAARQDKVVFIFNFFDELRRVAPLTTR